MAKKLGRILSVGRKSTEWLFSIVGLDLHPGERVLNNTALGCDSQLAQVAAENQSEDIWASHLGPADLILQANQEKWALDWFI